MIHLTLNQISAYIDAELPEASIELVRLHLSSCLECMERFGHIEEQESALARLLGNDPGDPFFERFAERVVGPAPAKKPMPQPPPQPPPAPVVKKPEPSIRAKSVERPDPITAKSKPEPVTVKPKAEPVAVKPVKPAKAERPAPRRDQGMSRVLLPAAALLLVASAVAVLVVRPRIPALSPPSARPSSGPEARSSGSPAPAEPHATAPPARASDHLERAAALSADADRRKTAEAHDAAASAWEEAIPELQSDPDELAAGRREIAAARYQAWVEGATPERRDAATRAVRAYLLCAPAGAERDRAWTWLADLKR